MWRVEKACTIGAAACWERTVAVDAGTKLPHCARYWATPTALRSVDLPPQLGPVRMAKRPGPRRPQPSCTSLGTTTAGAGGGDHAKEEDTEEDEEDEDAAGAPPPPPPPPRPYSACPCAEPCARSAASTTGWRRPSSTSSTGGALGAKVKEDDETDDEDGDNGESDAKNDDEDGDEDGDDGRIGSGARLPSSFRARPVAGSTRVGSHQ